MKNILIYCCLLVSLQISASFYIRAPFEIEKGKEREFGIGLRWRNGGERTHMYLNVDESRLCKLKEVSLFEKFDTIGQKERVMSKLGKEYYVSFSNSTEYEYVAIYFLCLEGSTIHNDYYFRYTIGKEWGST